MSVSILGLGCLGIGERGPDMIEFLQEHIGDIVEVFAALVGVFAMIATMTPNKSDNVIADKMLHWINVFGANFGKAKNG